jgi:hypothetical protein
MAEMEGLAQTSYPGAASEAERLAVVQDWFEGLARCLPAAEREMFDFWIHGHFKTAEWAQEMGLGHLPPELQAIEVRHMKDRIRKMLRRKAPPRLGPGI